MSDPSFQERPKSNDNTQESITHGLNMMWAEVPVCTEFGEFEEMKQNQGTTRDHVPLVNGACSLIQTENLSRQNIQSSLN